MVYKPCVEGIVSEGNDVVARGPGRAMRKHFHISIGCGCLWNKTEQL